VTPRSIGLATVTAGGDGGRRPAAETGRKPAQHRRKQDNAAASREQEA